MIFSAKTDFLNSVLILQNGHLLIIIHNLFMHVKQYTLLQHVDVIGL